MAQKNDKKQESVKKYLLKNIVFTILGMVIVSLLLLFLTVWGLDSYTRHGQTVKVPAIKGLSLEDAEKLLGNSGLKSEVISSMYTGAKPGTVIEVVPDVNSNIKKNRVVYLVIEPSTPQLVAMPDLRGFSSRQALSKLNLLGFTQVTIENKPSPYKGNVLDVLVGGQAMTANQKFPKDTPVTLVVGLGGEIVVDSIFEGLINDSIEEEGVLEESEPIENSENPYFD